MPESLAGGVASIGTRERISARKFAGCARGRRVALAIAGASLAVLCGIAPALGAGLPNPCTAVSPAVIAAAFGQKHPPPGKLSSVTNTATCSYGGGKLTVFVGYTAIVNPAPPAKAVKVPGLPHGMYMTYSGSTQSEITFYKGSTATGVYGVVRNYAAIGQLPLEQIARALYGGIAAPTGTQTTPSIGLVGG